MIGRKKLATGIEDYRELVSRNLYYVDKTLLIQHLLDSENLVTLYARPRRFGKSLNLSMLDYFFNVNGAGKGLFEDCALARSERPYREEMGKYPVISMSLKDLKMDTYEQSVRKLRAVCANVFSRYKYLLDCNFLFPAENAILESAMVGDISEEALPETLLLLMSKLHEYHQQPVVFLLDEYDVPLQTSFLKGYYERMLNLVRSLMSMTCKTNPHLRLAVHTGCLRISGESIYTGFNNPNVNTVLSPSCGEDFGFSTTEVQEMLDYYEISHLFPIVREWYDGYRFGSAEIYNPWSVINFVKDAYEGGVVRPQPYWSNTSDNALLQTLITESVSGEGSHEELEKLLSGASVKHTIREQLNYDVLKQDSTALWTTLLYTGYLRTADFPSHLSHLESLELRLPNREIEETLKENLELWYARTLPNWNRTGLVTALAEGDTEGIRSELNVFFRHTISYHDRAENFYHGFIAGLLSSIEGWRCESNRESGDGRPDLKFYTWDSRNCAIVIEIKQAKSLRGLPRMAQLALKQALKRDYIAGFKRDYRVVRVYGVACYGKECMVLAED